MTCAELCLDLKKNFQVNTKKCLQNLNFEFINSVKRPLKYMASMGTVPPGIVYSVFMSSLFVGEMQCAKHDDIIKWKHFSRYWLFMRGIHRSPVNPRQKGQWRGALMFSCICTWINGWVNSRETGDLRRHHAHYDDIVMCRFRGIYIYAWPYNVFSMLNSSIIYLH